MIPKGVKLAKHEADGKVAHGAIEMTDQKIAVTPGTGTAAAPIPVGDAAYVVDEKAFQNAVNHNPNFFQDWKGNITAGASLVEATQTSDTFTGTVNLVRAIPQENWLDPRNRTLVNFTASYGTSTSPARRPSKPKSWTSTRNAMDTSRRVCTASDRPISITTTPKA